VSVTALGIAPLRGKAVMLTAASPTIGDCNVYNTVTAGTALNPTLPQLGAGIQTVGGMMLLEKDPLDGTGNTITFSCFAGDSFTDTSTSLVLAVGGIQCTVEVVQIPPVTGGFFWKIISGNGISEVGSFTTTRKVVTIVNAPTTNQTINTNITDVAKFTGVGNALNLSAAGSPDDEQLLKISVIDNGTSRPIAFNGAQFGYLGAIGGLPANTPAGKHLTMQFFWDASVTRWILSAIDTVGY
jgi:hypothetical protein